MDAWEGRTSRARVDQGMVLLQGGESAQEAIALCYGLEEGARRFYTRLAEEAGDLEARELFDHLARAEDHHQERLWREYRLLEPAHTRVEFESRVVADVLEGGRTADQVLADHPAGAVGTAEGLELAMSLEVDSLDLYRRLADASDEPGARRVFLLLAGEERAHLRRLGELLGRKAASGGQTRQ